MIIAYFVYHVVPLSNYYNCYCISSAEMRQTQKLWHSYKGSDAQRQKTILQPAQIEQTKNPGGQLFPSDKHIGTTKSSEG